MKPQHTNTLSQIFILPIIVAAWAISSTSTTRCFSASAGRRASRPWIFPARRLSITASFFFTYRWPGYWQAGFSGVFSGITRGGSRSCSDPGGGTVGPQLPQPEVQRLADRRSMPGGSLPQGSGLFRGVSLADSHPPAYNRRDFFARR